MEKYLSSDKIQNNYIDLDEIIEGKVEPHIYAFTTNTVPNYLKVGDTCRPVSVRLKEWKKIYKDLKLENEWSAMLDDETFFRDYSVHEFLINEKSKLRINNKDSKKYKVDRLSNEFFKDAKVEDVDDAINDINENYKNESKKYQYYRDCKVKIAYAPVLDLKLRDNQQKVVDNFKKAVKNKRTNLLMYAVMRFGKSFTAMNCALAMNAKIVMIVSAKATVDDEWQKTIQKDKKLSKEFVYLDSDDLLRDSHIIEKYIKKRRRVAIFSSLQDLDGKNNTIKEKHKELFNSKIDLLIVDETHFGARGTTYGKPIFSSASEKNDKREDESKILDFDKANEKVKQLNAKVKLHLSGTPYRILMGGEFKDEDIIAFVQFTDIKNEQDNWDKRHFNDIEKGVINPDTKHAYQEYDNPYFGFPEMIRFAFNPTKNMRNQIEKMKEKGYSASISDFFSPQSIKKDISKKHLKFEHEKEVLEFLQVIDGSKTDENVLSFLDYPKIKEGSMCHHIVMVLPYRASCDCMEKLIIKNKKIFKNLSQYEILNITGLENEQKFKSVDSIKEYIKKHEDKRTLTLTVNRMLTGSTVPQWDTMIYLKSSSSAQEYDQSIFRLQNPFIKESISINSDSPEVVKINMKPQTLLVDFDPDRMFIMQELKSQIYDQNVDKHGNENLEKRLKEELIVSPIITKNAGKFQQITPSDIMSAVRNYSANRGVYEETLDIPIDYLSMQNENIKKLIYSQGEFGTDKWLEVTNTDDEPQSNIEIDVPDEASGKQSTSKTIDSDESKEKESVQKKWRAYYSKILFFSTLTKSKVKYLSDIISVIDDSDDNKRIARNLKLNKKELVLINKNINHNVLSKLDYKIQNMNELINDTKVNELDRARRAIKKFDRLSDSEIITPQWVCKEVYNSVGIEKIINIVNAGGKILDIASTEAEFAMCLIDLLNKKGIDKEKYKNLIYSIPTSGIAYEFTRKIYEILGLNISNISQFYSQDIVRKNKENEYIDYDKIVDYILQKDLFSNIELERNLFTKEEGEKVKFDLVVGNPPYQETLYGATKGNNKITSDIFQEFQKISLKLADETCMIYPAKDYQRGKKNTLDNHLIKLRIFNGSSKNGEKHIPDEPSVFGDNVRRIPGDVGLFYFNNKIEKKKINYQDLDIDRTDKILPIIKDFIDIAKKLEKYIDTFKFSDIRKCCESGFVEDNPKYVLGEVKNRKTTVPDGYTKVLTNDKKGSGGKAKWYYVKTDKLDKVQPNRYKIVISSAYPNESFNNPNSLEILDKNEMFGRTKLAIYDSDDIVKTRACLKYLSTTFARSISLMTPYKFLYYLPDFDMVYDKLDWNLDIKSIDKQLYKIFGITEAEKEVLLNQLNKMI